MNFEEFALSYRSPLYLHPDSEENDKIARHSKTMMEHPENNQIIIKDIDEKVSKAFKDRLADVYKEFSSYNPEDRQRN